MMIFIVRRVAQGVVTLFLAMFLIYSILLITPGGPRDQINYLIAMGEEVDPIYIKQLEKQYGLDTPYPMSFFLWLFDPNDTTQTRY